MSQIFAKAIFSFTETVLNDETVNLPSPKAHFGVVELQAVPTVISTAEHEVVCVVDQSGSMSDTCKDGRTKMQHIVHTLKNIIHYFAEHPEVVVFLSVHSFDDSFHTILERTQITEDKLKVMRIPSEASQAMAAMAQRSMQLQATIQEGGMTLSSHLGSVHFETVVWR